MPFLVLLEEPQMLMRDPTLLANDELGTDRRGESKPAYTSHEVLFGQFVLLLLFAVAVLLRALS